MTKKREREWDTEKKTKLILEWGKKGRVIKKGR